jgi:hypothetical protein
VGCDAGCSWAWRDYVNDLLRITATAKPLVIVLAMAVGQNVIFDPCKEELVVVDVVLAVACPLLNLPVLVLYPSGPLILLPTSLRLAFLTP